MTVDFEEFSHFDADYEKHIKIYLSYVNILQIFTHLLCQRHRGDMKFASHCDVILFDHIFGVTFNSRANQVQLLGSCPYSSSRLIYVSMSLVYRP